MPTETQHSILGNLETARKFILGGNAFFTVDNGKGQHFTYRCRLWQPSSLTNDAPEYYMVAVLTGPDNTSNYSNIGRIMPDTGKVKHTNSAQVLGDAQSVTVLRWALHNIWEGTAFPDGYDVLHEGKCGICGRKLTRPESIESGIGPVCAGK